MDRLLYSLMSKDNVSRREAEAALQSQIEQTFLNTVQQLVSVFSNLSNDLVLRSFAGILIRSSIEKHSSKFTLDSLNQFRNILLNVWANETNHIIFHRLSHILAQISFISKWNELIPGLIYNCQESNDLNAIHLLQLIEIITDYSPESIQVNLNSLGGFLGKHITNTADDKIQIVCARATCACIVCLVDEAHRNSFRSALAPIMNVLSNCLSSGNEVDATSIIDHLVTVANIQPVFFKGSVDNIIGAMISIANSTGLEFTTRTIAIELVVTLAETAPALARRCEGLAPGLCPIAFTIMLEREETEIEWMNDKYSDEPVDGDFTAGEEVSLLAYDICVVISIVIVNCLHIVHVTGY